ncbi:hypothetical protein [Microbacterium sp. LWH10-1.2]|uniref:hypothetical protein n=1 Tax=Microbacterium sp. LWH10-1.2 TaxID=3135255 RepID=UPI0031387D93
MLSALVISAGVGNKITGTNYRINVSGHIGLEGPAGVALESVAEVTDADFSAAMQLARTFGDMPNIRDFSNHLLGSGIV